MSRELVCETEAEDERVTEADEADELAAEDEARVDEPENIDDDELKLS